MSSPPAVKPTNHGSAPAPPPPPSIIYSSSTITTLLLLCRLADVVLLSPPPPPPLPLFLCQLTAHPSHPLHLPFGAVAHPSPGNLTHFSVLTNLQCQCSAGNACKINFVSVFGGRNTSDFQPATDVLFKQSHHIRFGQIIAFAYSAKSTKKEDNSHKLRSSNTQRLISGHTHLQEDIYNHLAQGKDSHKSENAEKSLGREQEWIIFGNFLLA